MGQVNNGLKAILFSPLAADGGEGTAYTSLGWTAEDSAKLIFEEGEKKEFKVEEIDTPWFVKYTEGKKGVEFTIANPDLQTMAALFGGTITGTGSSQEWSSPDKSITVEGSKKLMAELGMSIIYPRVVATAKLTDGIGKNSTIGVVVTCHAMKSNKAGVPLWRATNN